ncbi:MAG: N-acetyltransferase [Haliea sp.]|nr:MAG: N-acetyltransferase [Haliea sp.]
MKQDQALINWSGRMRVRTGELELRQFDLDDTRCLYDLRNHASVRAFMPNPAPLDFSAHRRWVELNLADNRDFLMFIVRWHGQPSGFTLLKRIGADELELGVMFIDLGQKQPLVVRAGVATLQMALDRFGATHVVTYVRETHRDALALNQGMGFQPTTSTKPNERAFRTPADVVRAHPVYRRITRTLQAETDFV